MFHDVRPLVQFTPARAKKKTTVDELTQKDTQKDWEQKIDGERYTIHTEVGGPYRHACTSRRQSEVTGRMVEKTNRVPHLMSLPGLPPKSLLDNEFVASADAQLRELPGWLWDRLKEPNHRHMKWIKNKFGGALPIYPHVGNTVSIMGSLGPEAVWKQEQRGPIWSYCLDIMQYQGKDLRANSQAARRRFLAGILESIDPESGLILMPAWQGLSIDQIVAFFYLVTDPFVPTSDTLFHEPLGGEGLIGKDQEQRYDGPRNWWKLKKDFPVDAVYTGVSKIGEEGKTGKMLGLAASLEIGVYHMGELYPVGWISAIRDGLHRLQTPEEHMRDWALKPVECRHNGLQKDPTHPLGYTLRHPRFRRDRSDKNPKDCTFETMYAEASKRRD